jgi:hypothetical protein
MTQWEYIAWWFVGCIGILGSAMCSGLETGCYTLNRVRLALRAGGSPPDAHAVALRKELSQPDRFVAVCLIANNVFGYLASLAATAILLHYELAPAKLALANAVIVAPLLFVFGEALPKELFRLESDRLTYRFSRVLTTLRLLLTYTGMVPLLMLLTRWMERASGLSASREPLGETKQRVANLLKEGRASGALSESQATLVDRALAMTSLCVRDEMVPWHAVRTIGIESSPRAVRQLFATLTHSRLPVTDKSGTVLGIVRQMDLYTRPEASLRELLREPVRLTPAMSLQEAIERLGRNPTGVAIVEVDESPVGMATVRDLVEPLTGELPDL